MDELKRQEAGPRLDNWGFCCDRGLSCVFVEEGGGGGVAFFGVIGVWGTGFRGFGFQGLGVGLFVHVLAVV